MDVCPHDFLGETRISNSGSSIGLKNRGGFLHVRFRMNRTLLVLGVVILVLGIAGYYVTSQTNLIGGRTHSTYPFGGIALAVLGALIAVGGVMMGQAGAKTSNQFKCAKCGATFGSQGALDQHSKDKHKI
jgi:hypothetical protein